MVQIDTKILPKTPGAFIVGGSIRDMLCGRCPTDYDVAVQGDAREFARRVEINTNGRLVRIGKPGRMILRVIGKSNIVDISEINKGTIEEDLRARDFTINAIAYELASRQLIDPLAGQQDLKHGTIRMVSRSIFSQDPIRLLRAYRMAAALQFEIESQTQATIKKNAALIRQSATERVREEFFKLLQCTGVHPYLCQMVDTGVLFCILPELSALNQCPQNRYHQLNAFEHTLDAFCHLEKLLETKLRCFQIKNKPMPHKIKANQVPLIKLSMLLHDIGKPGVQKMDAEGNFHFYDHERHGAKMAKVICRRLKCSNRDTDTIYFLVRHHMRPLFLFTALQEQKASPRALTRFFMKCAANIPALLILAAADMLGKEKQQSEKSLAFINFIKQLMVDFENDYKLKTAAPPLITGYDLINEFGLKPSPLFKKILHFVEIERLSRSDLTRQEAVTMVRRLIREHSSK